MTLLCPSQALTGSLFDFSEKLECFSFEMEPYIKEYTCFSRDHYTTAYNNKWLY